MGASTGASIVGESGVATGASVVGGATGEGRSVGAGSGGRDPINAKVYFKAKVSPAAQTIASVIGS
jgi:hypothetical protein